MQELYARSDTTYGISLPAVGTVLICADSASQQNSRIRVGVSGERHMLRFAVSCSFLSVLFGPTW